MDYKNRTKAQLLKDIENLHKKLIEFEAYEQECRMQAENLKSLNEDIDRKNKDLEILHTISNAVHKSLNLQHIYDTALDMATTLQDVDLAMIYLVSKDRKEAVLNAHRNLNKDYIKRAGRIRYGKGTTWKVINSGQVYNMEDVQKDKSIGPAGRDLGHRRSLGIPIILEGIVLGVIFLASFKEGKFSEQEIELNVSIGNHIGIAIAKAKLYEEMEEMVKARTKELEQTNIQLKQEIEERKRTENEIKFIRKKHEFLNTVKKTLANEPGIDSTILHKLSGNIDADVNSEKLPHEMLSNREYKVMLMIASGKSIKEIAEEIYISASTVSTYRERILKKLKLKTTSELIRYAINNNLVV